MGARPAHLPGREGTVRFLVAGIQVVPAVPGGPCFRPRLGEAVEVDGPARGAPIVGVQGDGEFQPGADHGTTADRGGHGRRVEPEEGAVVAAGPEPEDRLGALGLVRAAGPKIGIGGQREGHGCDPGRQEVSNELRVDHEQPESVVVHRKPRAMCPVEGRQETLHSRPGTGRVALAQGLARLVQVGGECGAGAWIDDPSQGTTLGEICRHRIQSRPRIRERSRRADRSDHRHNQATAGEEPKSLNTVQELIDSVRCFLNRGGETYRLHASISPGLGNRRVVRGQNQQIADRLTGLQQGLSKHEITRGGTCARNHLCAPRRWCCDQKRGVSTRAWDRHTHQGLDRSDAIGQDVAVSEGADLGLNSDNYVRADLVSRLYYHRMCIAIQIGIGEQIVPSGCIAYKSLRIRRSTTHCHNYHGSHRLEET